MTVFVVDPSGRGSPLQHRRVIDPVGEDPRRVERAAHAECCAVELGTHQQLVHARSRGHRVKVVDPPFSARNPVIDRDLGEGVDAEGVYP